MISSQASVSAFILAGGKSSRMGEDKAFLQLGERSLLERALQLARSVAGDVKIVGGVAVENEAKFSKYAPVVEDIYPDRGPLGGIHAALAGSQAELNLFLAVDLPFIDPGFLRYLLRVAEESEAIATVPRTGRWWQPLCAVYRRGFGLVAEESLLEDKNKVDALFASVKTRIIEEEELAAQGFSAEMFQNLNTPEEWKHAMVEIAKTKAKT